MNDNIEIAHFKVDPQLTILLGETYRSSEFALKELVDNAWDADAENVWITMPTQLFTSESIIIEDNGYGMTKHELKNEYLNIAQNRIIKRGAKTPKERLIKGRKGVGKFAGLVTATIMQVETWSRGQYSTLTINKNEILKTPSDIENIDLPIFSESCDTNKHGTKITLSGLNQKLNYPNEDVFKQVLFSDYGRVNEIKIFVNNTFLTIEHAQLNLTTTDYVLEQAENVVLKIGIADTKIPIKQAGIQLKVGGKSVGKPSFFGLENSDDIPLKQLKRIYGEVNVDSLDEFVAGNWGGVVENSKAFQEVQELVQKEMRHLIEENYPQEYNLALARLKKKYYKTIELLPQYKQDFAKKSLENVLNKYFGDDERVDTVISVIMEALQKDEYWTIIDKLDKSDDSDVSLLADMLDEFGLVEVALISKQANNRKIAIKRFEKLVQNPVTSEYDIHKSLEKNLWLINNHLSLYKSNTSIKKTIEEKTEKKYSGERAKKRPDLILITNYSNEYVLIELKKYDYTLKIRDATQAIEYSIDLRPYYGEMKQIIVIGGKMPTIYQPTDIPPNVQLESYDRLISKANNEIDWLLDQFTDKRNLNN